MPISFYINTIFSPLSSVQSALLRDDPEAVMDHMPGTGLRAGAAAETPFVIDHCVEIDDVDGIGGALLHAQAAGDAADAADRPGAGLGGRVYKDNVQ